MIIGRSGGFNSYGWKMRQHCPCGEGHRTACCGFVSDLVEEAVAGAHELYRWLVTMETLGNSPEADSLPYDEQTFYQMWAKALAEAAFEDYDDSQEGRKA